MTNRCDDNHNCCDCGCDHDHEEMETIFLTLEDDSEIECTVLGIFEVEENSYIALLPLDDEQVLLYQYIENEDGFQLGQIESEEEFDLVSEAFYALFLDEEEYDDEEYDDDYDDEE